MLAHLLGKKPCSFEVKKKLRNEGKREPAKKKRRPRARLRLKNWMATRRRSSKETQMKRVERLNETRKSPKTRFAELQNTAQAITISIATT